MDIVEKVDMVLNEHGYIVGGGVVGEILATAKLSGAQPEVAITLQDPEILANASFHPCVRLGKFDRDKTLNFVPPDGAFTLAEYWLQSADVKLPFHFRGTVT